ncbi:MAG: riboflavin synthase [Firmicutes bacterium]|nr:riboflavin synthase [Bacillota bacterium]
MFTGIIQELGRVSGIAQGNSSIRLSINCRDILDDIETGDSIAVNGICLTASRLGTGWFSADVMPETMRKTNLGTLKVGDSVNLESAMRFGGKMGGHIVTGHIDGTGVVADRREEDNALWITVGVSNNILKYIVEKGSVAVDGVSLTVAHVDEGSFKVSLIPHTAGVTTLARRRIGDVLNIECDIIGKYVEKFINRRFSGKKAENGMTLNFLRENGFA